MELALKESEEKFRTIFNSANDSIFLHEISTDGVPGNFIEVNEVACKTFGILRKNSSIWFQRILFHLMREIKPLKEDPK